MITMTPSTSAKIATSGFSTGLAGTIGYRVRDLAGNNAIARTTTGIVEDIAGSGIYRATITTPSSQGSYLIVWDDGTHFSTEELTVTYSVSAAAVAAHAYVAFDDVKSSLSLTNQTFADNDIVRAINAASRAIDSATGRRFWLDTDATSIHYYTPEGARLLLIDDVVQITEVAVDRAGVGDFTTETWTLNTDYVLEPYNNPVIGAPYDQIRVRYRAARWFPCGIERSVRITGQFGWSAVPEDIATATTILAHKLLLRVRTAPFGVLTVGVVGADSITAVRIARSDPDIANLIGDYIRTTPFI